jgi:DNA-binding CsgD family transcriptional regulator
MVTKAMFEKPLYASPVGPESITHIIDDTLWNKVNAALGGSARYSTAVLIQDPAPEPQIVVVVVERHHLPSDGDLRRHFSLTPRESEVARLMADRLSNEEIARSLGISVNTARSHCERVLAKLSIHTRNLVRTALLDSRYGPARRYPRGVA